MGQHAPNPLPRIVKLIAADRTDLIVLLGYTIFAALLALVVPLASQSLVNTIAAGVMMQQLIALSILMLIVLVFVAVLRGLQLILIETLQQRIFARTAFSVTHNLLGAAPFDRRHVYPPELLNRFFDVVNLQKAWEKILSDGPSSTVTLIVGLIMLAFYHPFMLVFDVLVIVFLLVAALGLTRGALRTSMEESSHKYALAQWLQDLARSQTLVRQHSLSPFWQQRTDDLIYNYLNARQRHFSILFRVFGSHLAFYVIAAVGVLAIGGTLVIQRQMTLGQLVASEIVVISVLSAVDKLINMFDTVYDLMTALEKIGVITDLPKAQPAGAVVRPVPTAAEMAMAGGTYTVPLLALRSIDLKGSGGKSRLSGINLTMNPGDRLAIVGEPNCGKTSLSHVIGGIEYPSSGLCQLFGVDVREVDLLQWHQQISCVGQDCMLFTGTLADNLFMGREDKLNPAFVHQVMELTGLAESLKDFRNGLLTPVLSEGQNLPLSIKSQVLVAQALLQQPCVLVLDEILDGMPITMRPELIRRLTSVCGTPGFEWALIVTTEEPEVALSCGHYAYMDHGKIVEQGPCHQMGDHLARWLHRQQAPLVEALSVGPGDAPQPPSPPQA